MNVPNSPASGAAARRHFVARGEAQRNPWNTYARKSSGALKGRHCLSSAKEPTPTTSDRANHAHGHKARQHKSRGFRDHFQASPDFDSAIIAQEPKPAPGTEVDVYCTLRPPSRSKKLYSIM